MASSSVHMPHVSVSLVENYLVSSLKDMIMVDSTSFNLFRSGQVDGINLSFNATDENIHNLIELSNPFEENVLYKLVAKTKISQLIKSDRNNKHLI